MKYSRAYPPETSNNYITMTLVGQWQDLAAYYRGSDGNYWAFQRSWVNQGKFIRNTRGETLGGQDINSLPAL
jgi:hypothetical protein